MINAKSAPDQISFTVKGQPVTQGSMNRSRTGHTYHQNGKALTVWRNRVLAGALQATHAAGWQLPLDEPVEVWAVFTLPRPASAKTRPYPHKGGRSTGDLDKLARAVGDALSVGPQRILTDDARIIGWYLRKDYGTPGATITISRDTSLRPKTSIWTNQTLEF